MRGDGEGERGQAASEYVALIALVACTLVALVGLTSGGLGSSVLAGLQRGLCAVAQTRCPRTLAERDRLAPCPLERRVREERLSETIASIRLGSSGTLTAVRGSDGRVAVTLADGSAAGVEVGVGARFALGRSRGAGARAGAALTWGSGRTWTFPDAASAARFVARHGDKATMRGKLVDELRSACSLLCDAVGWRPHPQLPEPDEVHVEGGALATLTGAFGLDAGGDASALLGRRVRRDGETTWYLRLSARASARLGLPGAEAATAGGGQALLSYRLAADGRPLALGIHLAGDATRALALAGRGRAGVGAAGGAGRGAAGGARPAGAAGGPGGARGGAVGGAGKAAASDGGAVELEATLDLSDPGDRAAAADLLDALAGDPRALPRRAVALGTRIAAHGQVDLRRYALRGDATQLGGSLALGIAVGGAFERTTKGLRLVAAVTRLPGLPFLPRDDCRQA